MSKRFVPLLILGGAALVVAITGTGVVCTVALVKSIQNEDKINNLNKEVNLLEEKALALKKFAKDEYLTQKDFKNAIHSIEKKVYIIT